MAIEQLQVVLGWCTVLNLGLLMWWGIMFMLAHDWVYQMHCRWFRLSEERFDALHYGGIAFYKLLIITFNVVPYLALRIVF